MFCREVLCALIVMKFSCRLPQRGQFIDLFNNLFIRSFEKTELIMGTRAAVGWRPEHLSAQ